MHNKMVTQKSVKIKCHCPGFLPLRFTVLVLFLHITQRAVKSYLRGWDVADRFG